MPGKLVDRGGCLGAVELIALQSDARFHITAMTHDLWQTNPVLAQLPTEYRRVRYVGARFPGSRLVGANPGLTNGANCQAFAYEVLRYLGLAPPPHRSSELWADTETTMRVRTADLLDLVLFNSTDRAWGAHVGVWVGDERVLHLCAEIGRPAVWPMGEFATRRRYQVLIGVKRLHVSAPENTGPKLDRHVQVEEVAE